MTLAEVSEVHVPRDCILQVHRHLSTIGREGHEGFGLWVGRQTDTRFEVTDALIPKQRHIRTPDGVCVVVEGDELHRINVQLFRADLRMVAQIHSHPGRAYHSDTDDAHAVATAVGCLSLVVPNFAAQEFELGRTATYRLNADGKWRELSLSAVRNLIKVRD